jgi:hypothetical protein
MQFQRFLLARPSDLRRVHQELEGFPVQWQLIELNLAAVGDLTDVVI